MAKIKSLFVAGATALALTFSYAAATFADGHSKHIVETAAGNNDFATLVAPSKLPVWSTRWLAKAPSPFSLPPMKHSQRCLKALSKLC